MAESHRKMGKEESVGEPCIITGSLTLGLFVSVVTIVMLVWCGHIGWARGFSVGAGLSLISLFSLGTVVPRLSMPTAPRASQILLSLVLFLKLPLYTIALYMVTHMPGVDARSAFPGILAAPLAITIKAVGSLVWQNVADAAYRRRIRRGGSVVTGRGRLGAQRHTLPEPASEQG